MSDTSSFFTTQDSFLRLNKWLYWFTWLGILGGITLTTLSWLGTCTQSCAEGHKYRIFDMKFDSVGFMFFISLSLLQGLSWKYQKLTFWIGLMLAGGLGAELTFIRVQQYLIKAWCPICLSIAAAIALAALPFLVRYFWLLNSAIKQRNGVEIMRNIGRGLASISVGVIGFFMAVAGITRVDLVNAAEKSLKQGIIFGNQASPIEIFVFTSWACPACRKAEPSIETMLPKISQVAKITFVDQAGDLKTLNYIPYNLSFMLKNKAQYTKLRHMLSVVALNSDEPTEEEVEKAAKGLGVKYEQLNYSEVTLGIRYFKDLLVKYNIRNIPAVIITNSDTKREERLVGTGEISEEKVLQAIETVSKK